MSPSANIRIVGAKALLDRGLVGTSVRVSGADGVISDVGSDRNSARTLDARGLLLLPGIVRPERIDYFRQFIRRRTAIAIGSTSAFAGSI